jgi:tRNA(Ile2) C34 agmatinyltransferase TiaS
MERYTVRRTDCGTGYQVLDRSKVYATVRRLEAAREMADELNRGRNTRCSDCGAALTEANAFHPYGDCHAYRCKDCEAAAWERVDAAAAARGPSTPANNVWD